jgi:hypothetical protein
MIRIAIDSDIFFFALSSRRKEINPNNIKRLLERLSSHPEAEIWVPITVLGESVIECLKGEGSPSSHHGIHELHDLVEFWGSLNLGFLYPSDVVVKVCYALMERYKDQRFSDTDRMHIAYAMAYKMDYFMTTDKTLLHGFPYESELKMIHPNNARDIL